MNADTMCLEAVCADAGPQFFDARRRTPRPAPNGARVGKRAGALAVVVHDLKGPLANLSLLIEAMLDEAPNGPHDRRTVLAERAGHVIHRLEALLSGFLNRMQAFGDPLEGDFDDVDLSHLIEKTALLNEPLAARRKVRLLANLASPLHVRGDAQLLMQAIDNLVSNAVKHTRPGGRVICEAGPCDSGGAVLRIIDQGPGLSETDLRRAFRPFTRLSAKPDRPAASNGLGLWIVRLIAEQHGGRVDVANNRRGGGATFTLWLPGAGRPFPVAENEAQLEL